MGSPVDRVERAQPAALAAAPVAGPLRHAAPQPGRRGDQVGDPESVDRRRRDGAARQPGGTSPVDFIRGMGRAGARLDAYAHHPHPLSPAETPFTGGCARCTTISMATLERLLRETRAAFGSRTRIWLTELGYQTNPPDRILGVSWARQARSVAEAQRRAYSASGVDLLIQYLVRDEPSLGAWQSGLEDGSGGESPPPSPSPCRSSRCLAAASPPWCGARSDRGRVAGRTSSSGGSTASGRASDLPARPRAGSSRAPSAPIGERSCGALDPGAQRASPTLVVT